MKHHLNHSCDNVYMNEVAFDDHPLQVIVQASKKSAANSPARPSAPEGPARMVLAVPDEPARGRKPALRAELALVVTVHRYPTERLPLQGMRSTSFVPKVLLDCHRRPG